MIESIWFFTWGILWAIYFTLDGYDLGLASLRPLISKSDTDTRIIYNVMGPYWDGNEVWLITAGGVTFAAFPITYAVMFSTLYSPLLLILFCLIIRAVSFEFRGKLDSPAWRKLWDTCQFIGSFGPALLFGVAFANIFQGIPFDDKGIMHGTLLGLLNPYGLVGGVLFVLLFLVHGGLWLIVKTEGPLMQRAAIVVGALWYLLALVAVVFLIHTRYATTLWDNYLNYPVLFIVPLITVLALFAVKYFMTKESYLAAWVASSLTIFTATMFGIVGLYPVLFPSSLNPAWSLTAFNSSSTPYTLKIMLTVALIFVPIVIAYQTWVYFIFRDKVTAESIAHDEAY